MTATYAKAKRYAGIDGIQVEYGKRDLALEHTCISLCRCHSFIFPAIVSSPLSLMDILRPVHARNDTLDVAISYPGQCNARTIYSKGTTLIYTTIHRGGVIQRFIPSCHGLETRVDQLILHSIIWK